MVKCPECGEDPIGHHGDTQTLLGIMSFEDEHGIWHTHDSNCLKMDVSCANGHYWTISEIRTCDVEGCDWKGEDECFCHPGKKIEKFPDLPFLGFDDGKGVK